MKRSFDIVMSGLGLLLLSPLFLIVAILIKLDSRGGVFFKHERIGRHLKPFKVYKFRTMIHNADAHGPALTVGHDTRITSLGKLLRRRKIDELPQLINVFKGEMSLVGPRPEIRRYVDIYREEYQHILQVRPGITDAASLRYSDEASLLGRTADPERHYVDVVLPEKLRLSKAYVGEASFLRDIKLICSTLLHLIYPEKDKSMPWGVSSEPDKRPS